LEALLNITREFSQIPMQRPELLLLGLALRPDLAP